MPVHLPPVLDALAWSLLFSSGIYIGCALFNRSSFMRMASQFEMLNTSLGTVARKLEAIEQRLAAIEKNTKENTKAGS